MDHFFLSISDLARFDANISIKQYDRMEKSFHYELKFISLGFCFLFLSVKTALNRSRVECRASATGGGRRSKEPTVSINIIDNQIALSN